MRVLKTTPGKILDIAFSPDSRAVAAAVYCAPGLTPVFLWNLDSPTGPPVRLETDDGYFAGGLGFSSTGRQLSWLTLAGRRTYDRDTRSATAIDYPISRLVGLKHACDASGERAVSSQPMPAHALTGWKRIGTEWIRQWQSSTRDLSMGKLFFAPAGDRFATFTRDATGGRWWEQPMRLEVRSAATGAEFAFGKYPYSYAGKLAFHPEGIQIAGIHEMTVLAWQLPGCAGPAVARNPDSRKHFTSLAYHPRGTHLFATSNDATVHVFEAHSLARVNRYTWRLDELSAIALSGDGTLAAAGGRSGNMVVWDLD
jgi:WD40 repeat protein